MPRRLQAIVILCALGSLGAAPYETRNFRVHASTTKIAQLVGAAAEHHRSRLGVQWYGHEIKNWGAKCDVTVNVDDRVGASGSTKFRFVGGEVYGWRMVVNGSLERILDSVVPHEVNHTILACWFRRKVPRWADEGCATMVEHDSEQQRQTKHVEYLMREGHRIPLRVLLGMTRYPSDSRQLMALYSQGYSLTRFLIEQHGHRRFLQFLGDAHHRGWDQAIQAYYESPNIESLEQRWASWVIAGSPRLKLPAGQMLAESAAQPNHQNSIVRAQNSARTSFLEAPEPLAAIPARTRTTGPASTRTTGPASTRTTGTGEGSASQWHPATQLARIARTQNHLTAPNTRVEPRRATTLLQPLALTRVDPSHVRSVPQMRDPLRGVIQSSVPIPQPDMRAFDGPAALTQPILRETRLRKIEPVPRAEAFGWERFPNRGRPAQ